MSPEPFRLGVNYWPARQAMAWLDDYDPDGTRRDFGRCSAAGLTTIRVFVRWADVQPDPDGVDATVVSRVVDAADAAAGVGAELISSAADHAIPLRPVGHRVRISGDIEYPSIEGGRPRRLHETIRQRQVGGSCIAQHSHLHTL